ncbi:MAG TPA: hypothetical protein VFP68_08205 [Burkholderiaceae bacterium]|nr:hypothetical protein [Burkholderiaceae bacterium]
MDLIAVVVVVVAVRMLAEPGDRLIEQVFPDPFRVTSGPLDAQPKIVRGNDQVGAGALRADIEADGQIPQHSLPFGNRNAAVLHVDAQGVERAFAMVIQAAGLSREKPLSAGFDFGAEIADSHYRRVISRRIAVRGQESLQLFEANPVLRLYSLSLVGGFEICHGIAVMLGVVTDRLFGGIGLRAAAGLTLRLQERRSDLHEARLEEIILETAVERARAGRRRVCWQGATTTRAQCPLGGATPPARLRAARSGA